MFALTARNLRVLSPRIRPPLQRSGSHWWEMTDEVQSPGLLRAVAQIRT